MRKYKAPRCTAPDEMGGKPERPCGLEMKLLNERHPLWRPGHWMFICPRCESLRALSDQTLDRYVPRQ